MRPLTAAAVLSFFLSSVGCGDGAPPHDASTVDGGADVGDRDAGPPDCDLDPSLVGCVPPERPAFPGLSSPVEIVRDADGVPHIYGANARDTMYGDGYAQAFDRVFEMDLARRRALGRRAEVLGPTLVDQDRLTRVVDIARWGRANEAALYRDDPELWGLLQAWVEGVNARIDEVLAGTAPLPPEFTTLHFAPEHWTAADALAFGKLVLFGNANQIEYTLLAQILAQYFPAVNADLGLLLPFRDSFVLPPEERPSSPAHTFAGLATAPVLVLPPDAEARLAHWQTTMRDFRPGASNNWAIDGAHTEDGRPLIAGDPHQPLQSPSLFWMHHLVAADGSLDVIGWSFVGGPTVSLGHNRHVAWTATTTYDDMMDLWDVTVHDGAASVAGTDVPIRERHEQILVAGAAAIELVVQEVPGYGVLLPDDLAPLSVGRHGRHLLFRWTGFGVTHELEGFMGFDRAASRADLEAAVDRIEIGSFNFVSADAAGISYRASPRVPDRGPPSSARPPYLVLDGDDPATYWSGDFLEASLLPHSHGGTRGWIGSANNDPYGFIADGSIDGDPFYYGVFFDPGVRSARIEGELTRLVARGAVTVEDMESLQDDSYTLYADDYVPLLTAAWSHRATDSALAEFGARDDLGALVTSIGAWDRRMERSSSAAVAFHAFMFFLAEHVLRDDLSLLFDPILQAESAFVLKWLSGALLGRSPHPEGLLDGESVDLAVLRSLDLAARWLTTRFPSGAYTWADLHGTVFESLSGDRLAAPWAPTDGSCGTLNRADTVFFASAGTPHERLDANDGAIYRMVARFRADGTPEAFFTMGQGNSGEPTSSHWDDLRHDWIETHHRPLRYERAQVEADPVETMTLAP